MQKYSIVPFLWIRPEPNGYVSAASAVLATFSRAVELLAASAALTPNNAPSATVSTFSAVSTTLWELDSVFGS